MLPPEATVNPPDPRVVLPSVSGVLSTIVASLPLTPTEPVNVLAGSLNVTEPEVELAAAVVEPVTANGPL
jgi:hypothetical protein